MQWTRLMYQTRQRLLRPTYLSVVGSMMTSGAGQMSLVLSGIAAARILGVHGRGELALFILVPLILTVLGALGAPIATTFFIARDQENAGGVVQVVWKLGVIQALVTVFVHGVVLLFLYHSSTRSVQIAAAMTLTLGPTKLAQDYGSGILQGTRRFRAFNVTRLLPSVNYAALIGSLFILGGGHLVAVTACYVLATGSAGAITLLIALRGLPDTSAPERNPSLSHMVKFGLKAMLGAVYPTEAFQLDQAFVGLFLSRAALGTYVVGVSFTNLPRFMAQSIGLVAYPHVAAIRSPNEARRVIWRFFWLVFAMSIVICVSLEVATPWLVPLLFGSEFRRSIGVTQVLLIASFIVSVRRVLADGMRGAGYPTLGTYAEVSALVLLIPALTVLIPLNGLMGAAEAMPLAAAGGFCVLLAGVALAGHKQDKTSLSSQPDGRITNAGRHVIDDT